MYGVHVITDSEIAQVFEEDAARYGFSVLVDVPYIDEFGHADVGEEARYECLNFWLGTRLF